MTYIGHLAVRARLSKMLKAGLPNRALLFVGPAHVGKATLARKFAQIVSTGAEQKSGFDLDKVLDGDSNVGNVDVIICAPEKVVRKNGSERLADIGAEEIREAVSQLARSPLTGVRQVLVVDGADYMTVTAQNALLKTLEEPIATSVIVLVVAQKDRLLPTVLSRVETINFSLIGDEQLREFAQNLLTLIDGDLVKNEKDVVDLMVAVTAGRPGLAHQIATDDNLRQQYHSALKQWQQIGNMTIGDKIMLAGELSKDDVWAGRVLELWTALWRGEILRGNQNNLSIEQIAQNTKNIVSATKLLDKLANSNANLRLALEDFLFGL